MFEAATVADPPANCCGEGAPYRLVKRDMHADYRDSRRTREVSIGGVIVGGERPAVIAGPCAVESFDQTLAIARACRDAGADMLRGGAYKPRTSPYDFQGLGRAGLEILAAARDETGLPIVTEALDPRHVEEVARFADCIQIGARNMQNFPLLSEAGKCGRPVLLKRHWAATLNEWLSAAEYIAVEGNLDILLCERGIRSFTAGSYNRSTLDLNVVEALRQETFLPVMVDPSHGTGDDRIVPGASLAGIAAGAHGLIIEVIAEATDKDTPLCDGYQSIRPSVLKEVIAGVSMRRPHSGLARTVLFVPVVLLVLGGCGPGAGPEAASGIPEAIDSVSLPAPAAGRDDVLRDVLAASGILHRHVLADGKLDTLIESVGSGVTVLDADGDGRLDLYFLGQGMREGVTDGDGEGVAGAGRNRLYRNLGDFRFEDVTDRAGVGDDGYGFMAVAADLDDDGDQDLYVLNDGPNVLYLNRGDGTFEDVTESAGVAGDACSVAGAAIDADGDGRLDLYVGNYVLFDGSYRLHYAPDVFPGPLAFEPQADVLLLNAGDGSFRDATEGSGLDVPPARAMGVSVLDANGDGRLDLYVANDATANFLFLSEGDGRFSEAAAMSGVAYGVQGEATAAMAGVVGDVDGDGRADLHVTDSGYGSLFHNAGGGVFVDRVVASGIAAPSGQWASWGGGFLDFDLDGVLDLYIANGDLHRATGRPDLLFRGTGDLRFDDVSADAGAWFRAERMARGAALADLDDDGRMDVIVCHAKTGHASGLGARVIVSAGGREHALTLTPRCGYLSQGDPRIVLGLGASERVDRIQITWPGGETQEIVDLAADRVVIVREGESVQ